MTNALTEATRVAALLRNRDPGHAQPSFICTRLLAAQDPQQLLGTCCDLGPRKRHVPSTCRDLGTRKPQAPSTCRDLGTRKEQVPSSCCDLGARMQQVPSTCADHGARKTGLGIGSCAGFIRDDGSVQDLQEWYASDRTSLRMVPHGALARILSMRCGSSVGSAVRPWSWELRGCGGRDIAIMVYGDRARPPTFPTAIRAPSQRRPPMGIRSTPLSFGVATQPRSRCPEHR